MTIERPMFPPRPGSNIVAFRMPTTRRQVAARISDYDPDSGRAYPRRNSRNPLRKYFVKISIAITEANKLDHLDSDWLDQVRSGAEAARILANELGLIADRREG